MARDPLDKGNDAGHHGHGPQGFDTMARDPLDKKNGAGHHGHEPQGFDTMAKDPLAKVALAGAGGMATRSAGGRWRRGAPANLGDEERRRTGSAAPARECLRATPRGSLRLSQKFASREAWRAPAAPSLRERGVPEIPFRRLGGQMFLSGDLAWQGNRRLLQGAWRPEVPFRGLGLKWKPATPDHP